jgi:glycine dehydrogenase
MTTPPPGVAAPAAEAHSSTDPPPLQPLDTFARRHLGQAPADRQAMLDAVGVGSVEALIEQTVPADIRTHGPLRLAGLYDDAPLGETAALAKLRTYARQNRPMTSMIGMGYHGTITPPVILRNVLENPRWYTPYTPYQAEIAQGRLEALLNFQTMVSDLTGLPLAGASLLDEATAAAEAMAMCFNIARQKRRRFLVAGDCHPQTIAVVQTRAAGLGIEVELVEGRTSKVEGGKVDAGLSTFDLPTFDLPTSDLADVCGVLVQYPATDGVVHDFAGLAERVHTAGGLVVAATDLLACCLLRPPGGDAGWGADIAVGSSQRFGVPMGYGGPHAAFLATRTEFARKMPGRLIGVSKDAHGRPAYRMAIQTREQHIKRDKATSNICTAQVLLAITAGFYAVYHGPDGLHAIAQRVHRLTRAAAAGLRKLGYEVPATRFFDTITVKFRSAETLIDAAAARGINLRQIDATTVGLSLDQTTTPENLRELFAAFAFNSGQDRLLSSIQTLAEETPSTLEFRPPTYLDHPVFHSHRTEHELLRYANRLIAKDYGLADGMIPLGSCTMKLNAAAQMIPVTWPGFADLHPFAPAEQATGYRQLFTDLESWLAEITGFAAVSLQPNAGSQGEYAGLMAIRAYHQANAKAGTRKSEVQGSNPPSPASKVPTSDSPIHRCVCLIPTSAHGTNPASAVIAGMTVVPVACRDNGDIDLDDLRAKAEQHADILAALMITYPSTHGVFEDTVVEACRIVHDHGGLVYMDGANLNAQVGLTSPAACGADVCHLNLHKTFCIPHGGGGPGMGPIGVTEQLAAYLPSHPLTPSLTSEPDPRTAASDAAYTVSAAPYGSPMILPISWMYIATMGPAGLRQATEAAILNANYMAARLREHFDILYTGPSGTVAHEFIVDCRPFDKSAGVSIDDIAKRLMDYGFHAPTMSWPVAGTLMIEPTESESKAELDRFCDAMIGIRREIARIEAGQWPADDHPLKHAPHTAAAVSADDWPHPYPRSLAAYPAGEAQRMDGRKFWPSVGRIDNPHGDRHLVCTCPPMEAFAQDADT